MNEGVISTYEQLFGGSGLPSDIAIEMAAVTSIHAAIGTDCHKEITPQQSQHQHTRSFHHTTSTYNNFIGTAGDGTTQNIASTQMGFTCNNNSSATFIGNGGSNTVFTQIPFVQIHTTDVQPQSAFNSTRFRRNVTNNQEEIKAEPIKSENSEGAKERINGTPTPPVPVQQRSESQTSKNFTQNEKEVFTDLETIRGIADEVIEQNTKTCNKKGTAFTSPDIFKCQHCAFISLTERGLQLHLDSRFQGNSLVCKDAYSRRKLLCPGCENVFYAYSVVEIHLREDHLMSEQDVIELMQTIKKNSQPSEQSESTNNEKGADIEVSNDTSIKRTQPQPRSRIYLKNVECLREPNRDPIEQQDNLINDSIFHFENVECNAFENIANISMEEQDLIGILTNGEATFHNKSDNNVDSILNETITPGVELNKSVNPPKQKISIKSVDVLREPALLRRDYEMQSFGDFINVCNDLNLHASNTNNNEISNCDDNHNSINGTDVQYCYSVTANREPLVGNNGDVAIADFTNDFEKPRRPKIYIKNVDILKEPMTFSSNINAPAITESTNNVMNFNFMQPTIPQTVNSYLDTVDSLNATVPTFNSGMSQLPLGTISDQYLFDSGGGNFLVNSSTTVSDNYTYGNEQTSEHFLMDTNRFTDAITPMTTEPTPPPPTTSTVVSNTNNCTIDAQPTPLNVSAIASVPKQKIFIKNVDILKEPQFQEPRGLLHLRTVDELNLMNRKEVENLIAPNLEGNQTNLAEEELGDNFARLNNANGETLSSVENCNASNLIEAISYGCEGFKLNEFSTQNGWHDDYDLGDDIREIITSSMAPTLPSAQKTIHELDTPQISLISIPDMEELTATNAEVNLNSESVTSGDAIVTTDVTQQQSSTNFTFECEIPIADINSAEEPVCSSENLINSIAISNEVMSEPQTEPESIDTVLLESEEALKQERLNQTTPEEHTETVSSQQTTKANNFNDIPPLTPMTSTTYSICANLNTSTSIAATTGLPVPPLVPMLPPKAISLTNVSPPANATERGRIYVANNLMQAPNAAPISQTTKATKAPTSKPNNTKSLGKQQTKTPIAVSVMGGTSVRGRPFGSNRTGITKLRKQPLNENGAGVYLKCTIAGCAFRFKKSITLDYHLKCHINESQPQSMACPECRAPFTNWNSLHTHLWRTHKIDLELYSCELCSFKTPIYSRLLNTHSKIHYDERNYKCDQCEKAFKNTKQLKNHRRWHRNHSKSTTSPSAKREISTKADVSASESSGPTQHLLSTTATTHATQVPVTARNFYRCKDCEAVFSHQKTLREHLCKNAAAAVQCELCDRVLTSRSSIKLHMQSHEPSRRFKCNICDYSASDHNAFRRHKMTHDTNAKMYACVHCDYKSIQSVAYQKHVQQKHPQVADSIVYKCKICPYATINKCLFDIHQVKHENKNDNSEPADVVENIDVQTTTTAKTKIKVKSHLLLTTSADSSTELNELCFDAVAIPT